MHKFGIPSQFSSHNCQNLDSDICSVSHATVDITNSLESFLQILLNLNSMSLNDSDSSDEETGEYTTTKVLLGYASKEPTDDPFSQLGGCPVSTLSLGPCQASDMTYRTSRHGWIRKHLRMPGSQPATSAGG